METADRLEIDFYNDKQVQETIGDSIYEKCCYYVAFQCAPVLVGIKPSNLLIVKHPICEKVKKEILEVEANYRLLYSSENRYIYLVYRKRALEALLKKPLTIAYLSGFSYEEFDLANGIEKSIAHLSFRLQTALDNKKDFPHEIGVFMGYPIDDILDFVKNSGRNYEVSGYWKVYHKKEVAIRVFKQYDLARAAAVRHIRNGGHLNQLDKVYKKAYRAIANS